MSEPGGYRRRGRSAPKAGSGTARQQPEPVPRHLADSPTARIPRPDLRPTGARVKGGGFATPLGVFQVRPRSLAKEEDWALAWQLRLERGQRASGHTQQQTLARQLQDLIREAFPEEEYAKQDVKKETVHVHHNQAALQKSNKNASRSVRDKVKEQNKAGAVVDEGRKKEYSHTGKGGPSTL